MNPLIFLEKFGYSKRQILGAYAKMSLGKSFLRNDVPQDVSCVVVVNAICNNALGFPIVNSASTIQMYESLRWNPRWRQVKITEAELGDVILSPTQGSRTGHTGFLGAFDPINKYPQKIYSNNSLTGKFDSHWSIGSWWNYYVYQKGLELYIYRLIL